MKSHQSNQVHGASTTAPPPARFGPRLVIVIGALSGLGIFSTSTYLPALPTVIKDVGTTMPIGQLTLTATLLGLAIGQVTTGPLSDAFGRRRPLLVGLVAFVLASILCALAPSAPALILFRFLQGFAGATGLVTAMAIVRDLFSGVDMARFLTFTGIVTGSAPVVAPLVGGQLLNFTSWRGIFVALAVLGAILFFAVALTMRETLPEERRIKAGLRPVLGTYRRLLGERHYLRFALSYGLGMAALFAYISASPFVLQNIHGLSAQMFSLVIGFNAIGGITAGQISGRLVRRVSPQRLLAVGLGLSLSGGLAVLVSVLASLGLPVLLPGFFLVASAVGFIVPNSMALALADHQREAGSAAGLMGLLGQATGGVVAPIVGIAGPTNALPMAATIVVLSIAAWGAYILIASRAEVLRAAPVTAVPMHKATLPAISEATAPTEVGTTRAS
jgi:DHA1 family bicyclomycin/chloramphenicol resistance-like MFS transporter